MSDIDVGGHSTFARVEKWDEQQTEYVKRITGLLEPQREDFIALGVEPYEVVEDDTPNLTTTLGLGILTNCLLAVTTTSFSAANKVAVGVGSGITAAAVGDTDLTTPSYYQVPGSAPSQVTVTNTNDTVQVQSTFGSGNANVAWQEWGIILATTGTLVSATTKSGAGTASLFNHKVTSMGTKLSGQTWAYSFWLTWS